MSTIDELIAYKTSIQDQIALAEAKVQELTTQIETPIETVEQPIDRNEPSDPRRPSRTPTISPTNEDNTNEDNLEARLAEAAQQLVFQEETDALELELHILQDRITELNKNVESIFN